MTAHSPQRRHPFLEIFARALAPHMLHGHSHDKDPPPVEQLLPPGFSQPELQAVLELFIAADHDVREDRFTAAALNLDLAESRIRLAISKLVVVPPAMETALYEIKTAQQEIVRKDTAHALSAVDNAVRCLAATPPAAKR